MSNNEQLERVVKVGERYTKVGPDETAVDYAELIRKGGYAIWDQGTASESQKRLGTVGADALKGKEIGLDGKALGVVKDFTVDLVECRVTCLILRKK